MWNIRKCKATERITVCACVRLAEVTQQVPETVSYKVQVTNHLQSSSATDQSETKPPSLFFFFISPLPRSLPLSPSALYSSAFSFVSCLSSNRLSIKRSIDSPDCPHSNRSLFFHPCNLSAPTSHSDSSVSLSLCVVLSDSLSLVNAQYSCIISNRGRSMHSFIFHCSRALNSLHKHRHNLNAILKGALQFSFEILF